MIFNAAEIANLLNGTIEGDENVTVHKLSKIEDGEPGSLSFLSNPKYNAFLYSTNASIVIVNKDLVIEKAVHSTLIRVDDAYSAFAGLLDVYNKMKFDKKGISPLASVAKSAKIGKDVYIGDFAYIGENTEIADEAKIYPQTYVGDHVSIGSKTILYPGVKIYHECIIGNDCALHSGVVIGSDGFGFAPQSDNNYQKIAQIGNVIIEDNVEIGSNTTVDRATMGSTIIRKGAKLDNLIMIAHNVEIGENTVVIAQTGISGSTKIGRNCIIAGQVGITGHLKIGNNVKIAAQSGVSTNVKDDAIIFGSPAFDAGKYRKAYVHFRNFQKIVDRIDKLEEQAKEGRK
jgi:UDP-3-O-[3-hydroxymyristoyl] glucosamine N-acyltransferase